MSTASGYAASATPSTFVDGAGGSGAPPGIYVEADQPSTTRRPFSADIGIGAGCRILRGDQHEYPLCGGSVIDPFERGRSTRQSAPGTSQAAVARLEAGGVGATLTTLQRVAASLDLTVTVDLAPAT